MNHIHLTPTEKRIYKMLADGLQHSKYELFTCLHDEMGTIKNLKMHISNMRKKLSSIGESIVCEGKVWGGGATYRMVRLISVRGE